MIRKILIIAVLFYISVFLYSNEFGNVYILRPRQLRTVGVKFDVELNQNKVAVLTNNSYTKLNIEAGEQIIYCYYWVYNSFVERNALFLDIEEGKDYYIELEYSGKIKPLNINILNQNEAENKIEKLNLKYIDQGEKDIK